MLLRKCFGIPLFIFLQIVNSSCQEGNSLAIAIDDTASMYDDIKYVKIGAEAILNLVLSKKSSSIKDLVLVTFNDPRVKLRVKTDNKTVFLRHVNKISTHSIAGNDCPEMALGGIESALNYSRPESYIFAFTDSNAKDYIKLNDIKTMCQRKQSQVMIVFSKDRYCFSPNEQNFRVFYEVAKACSGQVFIVEKDQVNSVLKAIEALLEGKTSIFQWIMVPTTSRPVAVKLTLDEKAEYALVSASGDNVDLNITTENNHTIPRFEWVMRNKNGKFLKLIDPKPGVYYAWVTGTSDVTLVVYGRTDFTFAHGFSVFEPKSLTDTSKQPIAGLPQHLSINVTDLDHAVDIQSVQILDIINDGVLKTLPLRHMGDNFYITDQFVSPNYTFRIAVNGEIKQGQRPIVRKSPNIDPQFVKYIPDSIPDIEIKEGLTLDVNYGSDISLTCEVKAHPAPAIEWFTSSGHLLPSNSSVVDDPTFVSYLKLLNIKQNETYICKASNKKGSGRDKRITVGVRPLFTVIGQAVHNAKYGEYAKIPCNIKSYLPIKIKWFQSGKELTGNTREHFISMDGSELTLKSMDIGMQGRYTCEATLNSDPSKKKVNHRDVKISDLAYPKVTYSTTVLNGKNFTAICRVKGIPVPIISWQFKPKGSEVFHTIPGSREELNIPHLRLKDTGTYKCIAESVLGKTKHDFDVVVEERPYILNEERTYYGVEKDLVMKIPCDVTGFPEPTIVWKKGDKPLKIDSKYKLQGSTLTINLPIQSDSDKYTCEATNKLGIDMKNYEVEIVDSFTDDENFSGNTSNVFVEEGKLEIIKCNLKIVGKGKGTNNKGSIRWYKDGTLTNQTGSTFTIKSTSNADGNYTCRVNTEEGSKSETYVVIVGSHPSFETNKPSPITIDWKNSDDILDCTADAQPPPTYTWLHNGKTVGAGENLQQIIITDWGKYTCQVNNIHGSISRTFEVISSGCYITENTATQNQPLVSDIKTKKWLSSLSNSDLLIEKNKEIKLSCPNNKKIVNAFERMPSKQEIIAKCDTQDQFIVDGKTYRYSDLKCRNKLESTAVSTSEPCYGPNSEMVRVGFEVNGFLETYKVCYNRRLNIPLYASASTILSRNGGVVDLTKFSWSSATELSKRKTGNWKQDGSCRCCYTKGQLVDVREIGFGPAQAATYKDNLNSVPVWNPCDESRTSWQNFNTMIQYESLENEKWSSWTGASDYNSRDGGLVPRYLWKVIRSDEGTVAMVYVNDPTPSESDLRCSRPCQPIAADEEYLYCCSLTEFTEKFGLPLSAFNSTHY